MDEIDILSESTIIKIEHLKTEDEAELEEYPALYSVKKEQDEMRPAPAVTLPPIKEEEEEEEDENLAERYLRMLERDKRSTGETYTFSSSSEPSDPEERNNTADHQSRRAHRSLDGRSVPGATQGHRPPEVVAPPLTAEGSETARRRPKKHRCPQCFKAFITPSHLRIHLRCHTGERRYECPRCPKAFTQRPNLNTHLRIHTKERPYQCPQCPKTFTQTGSLDNHLRIHTGERPYRCSQCPKSFTESGHLKKHLRIHTGERPYQCPQCPKAFTQTGSLDRHLRIHTGERPYRCFQCPKAFTESGNLKKHLRTHRGNGRTGASNAPKHS